ncbi:MAG: hypothetical protein WCH43_00350 [Verrucomicrobiota bacterium]
MKSNTLHLCATLACSITTGCTTTTQPPDGITSKLFGVTKSGQTYRNTTIYRFSVKK